jgi:hypothetical protein
MIVLESMNFSIGVKKVMRPELHQCCVELNSLSFGYATNTYWRFWISYDIEVGNWNFEKPKLPTYYTTPRAILEDEVFNNLDPLIPHMPQGHTSKIMRERVPDFPEGFHRVAWDYPVSKMNGETVYIHPEGHRYLTEHEIADLHGSQPGEVPPKILEYLHASANFYESGAWGEQNFEASFDSFAQVFKVSHHKQAPIHKSYDFRHYTPRLCCPVSDRYPLKKKSIFGG